MIQKAAALGADGIIKVWYDKESSDGLIQMMAWGTAVKFK
ncbi:MAG: heavy metal-binding domain-containing protein [Turicibacter sp.]|nr:heavy metal-binding domain-containing protein [Turicibacter sp.]